MSPVLTLRPYQQEALDAVFGAWRDNTQRPAAVLATGLGKTVIFGHLAQDFIERQTGSRPVPGAPGFRVVVLVHRDELADQAMNKLHQIAPDLRIGKVKAGDDDVHADVMVCSVQTLAREKRFQRLHDAQAKYGRIGLVIVDECHHAAAISYRNTLAGLGCYAGLGGGALAVGFTATLARGDGQGLGGVWEDAVFRKSTLWGIANGFLVDVSSKMIDISTLNLGDVKRSRGDYQAKDLGDALMDAGGPQIIRKVLAEHAADRRPIVFTPTVEVARATAEALPDAAYVYGGTPREERLDIYRKFRTGEVRTLVNCMVLTEGADFPFADCAVIARPTRSEPLFIQMVGRVLRPSPVTGKKDALVLILAGEGGKLCTLVDLEPSAEIREVKDGETLAEAYEREESEKEKKVPAGSLRFELKHRDHDLFQASAAYAWMRTPGGVQFIGLGGNGEILLWPSANEPEKWDVAYAPPRGNWERLHTDLDLGIAMAWAETEADDRSGLNMTKSASWRKKPASEKQLGLLRYLGVNPPEGLRAGDASNLIDTAMASRKLDRYLPRTG